MTDAADRLVRVFEQRPGYDSTRAAGMVAMEMLVVHASGVKEDYYLNRLRHFITQMGVTSYSVHASTLKSIAHDKAGLKRAVQNFLDTVEES